MSKKAARWPPSVGGVHQAGGGPAAARGEVSEELEARAEAGALGAAAEAGFDGGDLHAIGRFIKAALEGAFGFRAIAAGLDGVRRVAEAGR